MAGGDGTFTIDVGALFEEQGARVLAFTLRMLGNRADAEDATQETFLRAYRHARTYAGDSAASTWLFAIARNVCLDRLRSRAPRSFGALEEIVRRGARPGSADGTAGTGDGAAEAERRWYVEAVREGCLLATLACLSVDQRAAFVLRTLCGLSTADTARVLGRTENAVRVLIHRARRALKAFLCRNCSRYELANPCACANLVGFALARGWIGPDDRRVPPDRAAAAAGLAGRVIGDLARVTAVYTALPDPRLRPEVIDRITSGLRRLDQAAVGSEK